MDNIIQALKITAVIILSIIAVQKRALGTHIAGSHIGYRALDSVTYELTLIIYRDCNGVPISLSQIKIAGKSTGIYYSTPTNVSHSEITGSYLGCTFKGRCSGTYQYGIEKWVYKDTVDISGGGCEYTFSYAETARSSGITTGSANESSYNYAVINKCNGINNSVQADLDPQVILPVNRDAYLAPFVGDTTDEADSVGYKLVDLYQDSGVIIPYIGSYSPQKPINFLGFPNATLNFPAGFRFDEKTGNFSFRTTVINQQTMFCIEAREYRKIGGVMKEVGLTRLEHIVIVASGTNYIPAIKAQSIVACANQNNCIDFETKDQDPNDSTFLSFRGLPKGAVVTYGRNGRLATAKVCFAPADSQIRNNPYSFVAMVRDNKCQIGGRSTVAYSFTVEKTPDSSNIEVLSKVAKCSSADIIVNAKQTPGVSALSVEIIDEDTISRSTNDTAKLFFKGSGWKKFYVTVKTASCAYTLTDSIFINPSYSLQFNTRSDTAICYGGYADIFTYPINGVAPYTYNWRELNRYPTPFSIADSNFFSYQVLKDRGFYAFVVDSNYCIGLTDTVDVRSKPLPTVNIGNNTVNVCPRMPFTLTATPYGLAQIAHYDWVGIDTLQTVTTQTDSSRWYTVITTSTEGCTYTASTLRNVYGIAVDAGTYPSQCSNIPLLLTARYPIGTAPFKYVWLNTGDSTDTLNIIPLKDTAYIVKMEDANGCIAYDTAEIKVYTLPTFTPPADTAICDGFSVTLTAKNIVATTPYLLTWNTSLTGDSIVHFSSTSTKYIIEITDSNNCAASDSVQVTVNATPSFIAPDDTAICDGSSVTLVAKNIIAAQPYLLTWNTTLIGDTIVHSSSTSTKYIIEIIDSNNCMAKDSVLVTVNSLPSVTAPSDTAICSGLPLTLVAKNIVAKAPYLLTWNNTLTGDSIAHTALTTTKYILEITDSNGCVAKDSMLVTVYNSPSVTINTQHTVCNGTPILIVADVTGGTKPFNYLWSNGKTTDTFTFVVTKPEQFTVNLTDSNNCKAKDSTVISLHTLLKISAGTYPPICKNDTVQLKGSVLTGTPPYTFTWLPNNVVSSVFPVSPNVTTTYILMVQDTSGCVNYDSTKIVVNALPSFTPPPTTSICEGDSITLKVTGISGPAPCTFKWDNVLAADSFKVIAQQSKTIAIEMSDSNNCKANGLVQLVVNGLPEVQAGTNQQVCNGSIQFVQASASKGTPPYSYSWSNGASKDTFTTIINTPSTFIVGVTDSNGCHAIDSVIYTLFTKDSVTLTQLSAQCASGAPVNLVAVPSTGSWSGTGVTGGNVFNPSVAGAGIHQLQYNYTSSKSCPETEDMYVIVKGNPSPNFVANKVKGIPHETFNFTDLSTADSSYTLEWNFGDVGAAGNISSVTNPSFTYNTKGIYTVKLTINDGVCPPATETKVDYILVDSAVLQTYNVNKHSIKLYPNPAKDRLIIEADNILAEIVLVDVLGRRYTIESNINATKTEIDIQHLSAGIYVIEVKDIEGNMYTSKAQISR